jgi:hypothetical protein
MFSSLLQVSLSHLMVQQQLVRKQVRIRFIAEIKLVPEWQWVAVL